MLYQMKAIQTATIVHSSSDMTIRTSAKVHPSANGFNGLSSVGGSDMPHDFNMMTVFKTVAEVTQPVMRDIGALTRKTSSHQT